MLAAGASTRLGKPKQLLMYQGKTLLEHGLQIAIGTGIKPIMAVLGANEELLMKGIKNKEILVIINKDWNEGMASSIRLGLKKLLEMAPGVNAVILMVCDQPFISENLLEELVAKYHETGKPIIASKYDNSTGTPALFDKTIFASLLALQGDRGAKRIMEGNPDQVAVINFPLGNIDIDTDEDYERLLKLPPELPLLL